MTTTFVSQEIEVAMASGGTEKVKAHVFTWEGMMFGIHRGISNQNDRLVVTHLKTGMRFKADWVADLYEDSPQIVYDHFLIDMPIREVQYKKIYGLPFIEMLSKAEQDPEWAKVEARRAKSQIVTED